MVFRKSGKKVDFLIVGTQEGGTSAVDNYLRQHTHIEMAARKELHFFDDEKAFSKPKVNYAQYERNFLRSSSHLKRGEATPIYMYWTPACRRIWTYNPAIKLIFILRNPAERAFSHWNMEYDRKAERETFSFCIRNEEQRVKAARPLQHRVFSYADRGYYTEQIRRFRRFFREEQMLFIKYEAFKANQQDTLLKIFRFLEVDSENFDFTHEIIHARKQHAQLSMLNRQYLINKFEYDIREVEKLLKWDCKDWLT
ncbi:MAG: hypothetical protein ACI81P_000758 [Neolewinella sp.]|jgi:hypothetical protein